MRTLSSGLILVCAAALALAQSDVAPFLGRWDFNVKRPSGVGANWLGITQKNGELEIWFQPTGGNVYQVKDFHLDGSHLTLTVSPASASRKPPGHHLGIGCYRWRIDRHPEARR